MTVPHITEPTQIEKQYAIEAAKAADFGENWLVTANRALAIQNIAYQTICQPTNAEPTCQVKNIDTGELKTMTREAAKLLQAELGDTVEWFVHGTKHEWEGEVFAFDGKGSIYTYKLKANLVKLNGKFMTSEAAIALWESKKGTCELWFTSVNGDWILLNNGEILVLADAGAYELRERPLKQIKWKDVPVGVMTNKGELVCGNGYQCETLIRGESVEDESEICWTPPKDLRLAPHDQQPWLNWRGGECPVPDGMMVEVTLRDGRPHTESAKRCDWVHRGNNSDIIEYRITGIAEGWKL